MTDARRVITCPNCKARLIMNNATAARFTCPTCTTNAPVPPPSSETALPHDELPRKSAVAAGLLQLFLGWFGLGRFYLGYTTIGAIQLILGLAGLFLTLMCYLGLLILAPLSIWLFIEGIMMIAGAIPDVYGRKLR